MSVRTAALLCLAIGCGSNEEGDSDTDEGPGGACEDNGTANGCLTFEAECTADNNEYDGVPGGWYDDSDGKLMIQLAPNAEGNQIGFEILDASALGTIPAEFAIPTEVILHFTDATGTELQSCAGRVTITSYTPGDLLWGNWGFQAETVTGQCGQTGYWSSQGDFINLEPCTAR